MIITELEERERPAWDAYVKDSAHGLPMHLSGWRDVMSKTYGYETHYLMATEGEKVVGVLPLFIVRSFLVGSSAMTMPGGLCADNAEVAQALIVRGREIARQARIKKLVIQDTRQVWPGDLYTTTNHEYWVVDTRIDAEIVWNRLHRETRRQIRLARRNGLTVEIDRTGERMGEFHHVLSRFVHKAGAPVFGQSFLEHVIETFRGRFSIAVVYKEKRPLGAYFQLLMGNTVYGIWGATLHEYLKMGAAYLAYWEILYNTAINGYHFWDMGRSPAKSNSSQFKSQWGGATRPVYQQVAGVGGQWHTNSIVNRIRSDTKFQRFMQVWSKLPFPVVQFLGPKLRRHVPFA